MLAQKEHAIISNQMKEAFAKSKLPGLCLAMVSKDSILFQKSFGYSDISSKKIYDNNSIQNVGSISKTIIGVSLMKLVDQGKLKLDDPVNSYLPFQLSNPYFPESSITIRHLATHTSGIKDTPVNYEFKSYYLDASLQSAEIQKKGFSVTEKLFLKKSEKNKRIPLHIYMKKVLSADGEWYSKKNFCNFKPGNQYEYTNLGAALAAYIIEIVSGQSYHEFTKKEIINPLHMKSTGWFYRDVDLNRFVIRYMGKKMAIVPFYDLSTYPDGGMKTSIFDLSLFLKEMLRGYAGEGTLLTRKSFKTLFQNHLSVPDGERNGIFWDVFGDTATGDIGHSGADPGIYCFMYFSPITGIGKVLMTNASGNKNQQRTIELWEKFIRLENFFID